MPGTLVLSDFDLPTRSASGFLIRYIVPRTEPVHLHSVLARRLPFQLFAPPSDIIIGVGHGQEDAITGQNEAEILRVGAYSPGEVKGKVIKLITCKAGVALGPDLIKNGATSVLAYIDDLVWVMDADLVMTPWADKMAATVFLPIIDGLNALLDGKTAGESLEVELAGYSRNAEIETDELIKSTIKFDQRNAVLLGNAEARLRPRPSIMLPVPPPPLVIPIT